jgi:hypothetical protein
VAIETGLALLLAFFFAPFQHLHPDHAGDIHAHFFPAHVPTHFAPHGEGVHVEDDDDDHAHASPIDTFTIMLPAGLALSLPARAPVVDLTQPETFAPATVVEQRTHDPPANDLSSPRAPPL